MKRYIAVGYPTDEPYHVSVEMKEHNCGRYVKHEDHLAHIKELEKPDCTWKCVDEDYDLW